MPVRLDYRFTGSQVRSRAVVRALLDTAAVFYRLRLLQTYQRKRRLLGHPHSAAGSTPHVTVVGTAEQVQLLDYPRVEVLTAGGRADRARAASGDVLALLGPRARPAGNWLSACVPYFSRPEVAAVVTPLVAPAVGSVQACAAAAVLESRLGGASRRSQYLPGNVGVTRDYPTDTLVVRKDDYLAAVAAEVPDRELVGWLAERERLTVYTPDTMVAEVPPPLLAPHVRATFDHAVSRGAAAWRTRGGSLSRATTLALAPTALAALGGGLAVAGTGNVRRAGLALVVTYGAVVAGSALLSGLRFRSARVGALAGPALVLTHSVYVAGFVRGLARETR
jgi:hypothetical protein